VHTHVQCIGYYPKLAIMSVRAQVDPKQDFMRDEGQSLLAPLM